MLTETEARDLLARAAATIDVPPGAPLSVAPRRRRRWLAPAVAAAVAVLLIAGGALVLVDGPSPGRAPTTEPAASGDGAADAERIPSVFGYDGEAAETMLAEHGLQVSREEAYNCRLPGRADRTEPAAGTRFRRGDQVTLLVTELDPSADCAIRLAWQGLAWQLLDFANGRGAAPEFASTVDVYVNGTRSVLSGDEAVDADSWNPNPALGLLAAATRQQVRGGGTSITPLLTVRTNGSRSLCGGQGLPSSLAGRKSLWLSIALPTDGFSGCTFANVYQTSGRIDAVVVRTWGTLAEGEESAPEQDPDPDSVGARFLAYARGEANVAPTADGVRLYLGNKYQRTITAEAARDPESWEMCATPYAERGCGMSAVTTLRDFPDRPAVTDFVPVLCLETLTDTITSDLGSGMVVFGPAEPRSCAEDFAVQIWSNDDGVITAVNLLFGSP